MEDEILKTRLSVLLTKKATTSFVVAFLKGTGKETWKYRVRQLYRCATADIIKKLPVNALSSTAPVFAPWYNEQSQSWSRRFWAENTAFIEPTPLTVETTLTGNLRSQIHRHLQNVLDSFPSRFCRSDMLPRKHMVNNISDAKEQLSYSEMKGLLVQLHKESLDHSDKENKPTPRRIPSSKPEKPNNRKRRLEDSPETLLNKEAKRAKREKLKLENPAATPRKTRAQHTAESAENTAKRQINLRFYPSDELMTILKEWFDITDDLFDHCLDVYEEHLAKGYNIPPENQLRESLPLSDAAVKKVGGSENVDNYVRRQSYTKLPVNIQQEVIAQFFANKKSADSNMKAGNNEGYELTKRDKSRRWRWLSCTNYEMTVTQFGEVQLVPDHLKRKYGALRTGLPIKDRLTRHISPKLPTSYWGTSLLAGKNGGSGFVIRHDTSRKRWFLVLSYDAFIEGSPFRATFLKYALSSEDEQRYRFIRRWVARGKRVFENEHCGKGNVASIDPGSRKPITFFDFQNRKFFCAFQDFNAKQEAIYDKIAKVQSRAYSPNQQPSTARRRKRKKKRRKKDRRRYSSKHMLVRHALKLHGKAKAITTNCHNSLINTLVSRFDTIVIPEFLTMGMIKKRRKKLGLPPVGNNNPAVDISVNEPSATSVEEAEERPVRKPFTLAKKTRVSLQRFAHFSFRQRLFAKALADPLKRKTVVLTTEEYTTKQCPMCDTIHHTIGSSEVFNCPSCKFRGDRDCVGAFNIGLRAITKNEIACAS